MLGLEYQWTLANGAPLMCSSIVPSAPLLTPGLSVSGRLASPLGANRKSNCPFLPSLPFSSFSFWQQQQHAASFPSLLLSFIIFTQHGKSQQRPPLSHFFLLFFLFFFFFTFPLRFLSLSFSLPPFSQSVSATRNWYSIAFRAAISTWQISAHCCVCSFSLPFCFFVCLYGLRGCQR